MTETMSLLELAASRSLTVDDLLRLSEEGDRYELIDGGLSVTPLANVEHQDIATRLAGALLPHAPEGVLVLAGVNVIKESDTLVMPDLAVVSSEHLVRNGLGVAPAGLIFTLEITSPSTRRRDLTIKRQLYSEWKAPLLIVDRRTDPHTLIREGDVPDWINRVLADFF